MLIKSDDNHAVENSDFIAKLAESKGFKKLINFPTYGFPVSLKKIYFTNMGFNSDEIDHLILSEESFEFKSTDSEGRPLHYTQSHYLSTMTKRLSILRENGTKMGLLTPSDYFKAMKNWRGLVTFCLNIVFISFSENSALSISSFIINLSHISSISSIVA